MAGWHEAWSVRYLWRYAKLHEGPLLRSVELCGGSEEKLQRAIEQPECSQALEQRREKRRRQNDDRDVERVVDQVAAPVAHDGEHRDKLTQEREPDRPVEDGGDRPPRFAHVSALQDQRRDDKRGEDEHWPLKATLKTPGTLSHPRAILGRSHGAAFVLACKGPAHSESPAPICSASRSCSQRERCGLALLKPIRQRPRGATNASAALHGLNVAPPPARASPPPTPPPPARVPGRCGGPLRTRGSRRSARPPRSARAPAERTRPA